MRFLWSIYEATLTEKKLDMKIHTCGWEKRI